jgi:ferredoxin
VTQTEKESSRERSFRVVLETRDGLRSFVCGEREHILDAATANQINLPALCRQGRCLTCAASLVSGSVEHDHPDLYFPQDKAAGYILLCRAMPTSDVTIRTHQQDEMRAFRLANNLPAPYA